MGHDFCPDPEVLENLPASLGAVEGLLREWPLLHREMSALFWIEPGFILAGIKRANPTPQGLRALPGSDRR